MKIVKYPRKQKNSQTNVNTDLGIFFGEATTGFEPVIRVLQTRALPLGYVALLRRIYLSDENNNTIIQKYLQAFFEKNKSLFFAIFLYLRLR